MNVTVNTDASFCPDTKAGGYSVFVVSNRGKFAKSGMYKEKSANSTSAEVKALVNGVYWGISQGIIKQGDVVLLQCDCTGALNRIEKGNQSTLNKWASKYNLKYKFKHVKGHTRLTSTSAGRFVSNHINDDRAYKAMQKMRLKLKLQEAMKNAKI